MVSVNQMNCDVTLITVMLPHHCDVTSSSLVSLPPPPPHNISAAIEQTKPQATNKLKGNLSTKKEKPVFTPSDPVPLSGLADYIKNKKSSKTGFQHDYEVWCNCMQYPFE